MNYWQLSEAKDGCVQRLVNISGEIMTTHLVIPDTQVKPGNDYSHLYAVGKYIVAKKPDVVIHLGDHWDFPSLSSYDVGKKCFEGRTYREDVRAGILAMDALLHPLREYNARMRRHKMKLYQPRLVFLLGNHEQRIERAVESDRKLEGIIDYEDLMLEEMGWEVWPFLEPVVIDGVAYSHYFTSGIMGRPVSNARLLLQKKHMSCVQGHVQDRDIAYAKRADGRRMTGIFAGICYKHDEAYLNAQTNGSWAGVWMLHEVEDGEFDEMAVSLQFLEDRYGSFK